MFSLKWSFESCYQAQFHPDFSFSNFFAFSQASNVSPRMEISFGQSIGRLSSILVQTEIFQQLYKWLHRHWSTHFLIRDTMKLFPINFNPTPLSCENFSLSNCKHLQSPANHLHSLSSCFLGLPGSCGRQPSLLWSKRLLALSAGVPERVRQRLRDLLLVVLH